MTGYIAFNVGHARIADFDGIAVQDLDNPVFREMLVN